MDQFDLFGNKIETPDTPPKKKKVVQEKMAVEKKASHENKEETKQAAAPKSEVKKVATLAPKPPSTKEAVIPTETESPQHKVDEKELTKVYYTISEVAKMFDVNASLLRFWEKEFSQLGKIKKNKKGDRYYNKMNIRALNIIYYLLKEQKMTIAGAREMMKHKRKSTIAKYDVVENLQQVRSFLVDLKTALQA